MSIYNKVTTPDSAFAIFEFLGRFDSASREMQAAEKKLLEFMRSSPPDVRRQYDRTHKQMVRLRRAWNAIEHTRELNKESRPPTTINQPESD